MRMIGCAALVSLLLNVTSAAGQQAPVFRFERPVVVNGSGPRRLTVDVPLLAGGQPFVAVGAVSDPRSPTRRVMFGRGAADLRLFDASGREVPYLLVPPPAAPPAWISAAVLAIAPVETKEEKTSGFEADLGSPAVVNGLRVTGLAAPFLKRARLEGSGDRAHWTLLLDQATLFDLPQESLHQTELSFRPGAYQYLRLTWDDTRSARVPLPPSVAARVRTPDSPIQSVLVTPAGFERLTSEPGRSRFRVRLPAARLPVVALVLDVGGGHLLRPISVYEARLSANMVVPERLGTGTLRRVVQDGLAASSLRVDIAQPSEAQIDLDVDDGDNGPLELRGVSAEFGELPWIYFESSGSDLVARYGNESLAAPRYDLEAVRTGVSIDTTADAAWGEAHAGAAAETGPPAVPFPNAGASIDATSFRYVRAIPGGDRSLVRLSLDAAVLAHSDHDSFTDLRVIDGSSHQIPYLLERATEPLSLDLELEPTRPPAARMPPVRGARSFYRVRLPYGTLPSFRLVLATGARVFDRRVAVFVSREPDAHHRDAWMQEISGSGWTHSDEATGAPALTLPIAAPGISELILAVDEGDNSPLPLGACRLLLPSYRLRFFRDREATLRLAYGREDLQRPRYDIALLAPRLLGAAALDIDPAPEPAIPEKGTPAPFVSPRAFWAILAAAVVVLLALIVRLIGKDDEIADAADR